MMPNTTAANPPTIAWYRQFWPWFLIAFPAIAVVACAYTIWLAVNSPNDMVVDDYYKEGMAINQSLQQAGLASTLQLSAQLEFNSLDDTIQLVLSPAQPLDRVQLLLIHPLDAAGDLTLMLQQSASGSYRAKAAVPRQRWYVQLSGDDRQGQWRLQGELDLSLRNTTRLLP